MVRNFVWMDVFNESVMVFLLSVCPLVVHDGYIRKSSKARLVDRDLNFGGWNSSIPLEGVERGPGKVGVGAFGRAGQAHLDIVSDRLDARNAVRILLRCGLFQVRLD